MFILIDSAGTMWKWTVLLTFQRNLLPTSAGVKCVGWEQVWSPPQTHTGEGMSQ